MTFNGEDATYTPHSLHAEDNIHQGWINVLYYDGNARPRQLTWERFPVTIFNPLDETSY
jgi:prepilin-type processing-associated H-X9-DG protein